MARRLLAPLCVAVVILLAVISDQPREPRRSPMAVPAPPDIPSCEPTFRLITTIRLTRGQLHLSAGTKHGAFFSGGGEAGRIRNGEIEKLPIPGSVVTIAAVSKDKAWILGDDTLWFYDGLRAQNVPLPTGIRVSSLHVAGPHVWIGGGAGKSPAIFRRAGNSWTRVAFPVSPRFEHMSLTVASDGTPYSVVTESVPKPPPPLGSTQTDELRTKRTIWTWDGSRWREITPTKHAYDIVPATNELLYGIATNLEIQRRYKGVWSPVQLAPGAFVERDSEPDADRHWGVIPISTHSDADGRLWLGGVITMASPRDSGQFPGLWLVDGKELRRITLPPEMKEDLLEVASISTSRDGAIWLTTGTRVFRGSCS